MNADHEETLRIIRYFLPTLSEDDMRPEIDAMLKAAADGDAERRKAAQQSLASRIAQENDRLAAVRQEIEAGRFKWIFVVIMSLVVYGFIALAVRDLSGLGHSVILTVITVIGFAAAGMANARCEERLREAAEAARTVKRDLQEQHKEQVATAERDYGKIREVILGKLQLLAGEYARSTATEEEVAHRIDRLIEEVRAQAPKAAGVRDREVTDTASAEGSSPAVFRGDLLPAAMRQDAAQTDQWVWQLRDELIAPMLRVFDDTNLKGSFRERVLGLLGLHDSGLRPAAEGGFSSLAAVRFSPKLGRYLVAYCTYEQVMCMEDFVAVFRAYIGCIFSGIAWTSTSHIFYQEVVAIEVETREHRGRYGTMDIRQHLHSLMLSASDGSRHRLSGDGDGVGTWIHKGIRGESVALPADETFTTQAHNLRALIRDARRLLARDPAVLPSA